MLTDEQRKTVETRLLREREQVLDAIGRFDSDAADLRERTGELSVADQHQADYGSEAHEQEKASLLASAEGRRLYALDEALQLLYKEPEKFGVCDVCGRDIQMERLEVVPETRLCAEHARARDIDTEDEANPREASPM
ncbi:MAG TPA: TraR/DksA C4-type zinc finger protein [Longimicrobium sp.]|nr:TraR/DksA C4-type zinc finger protein [Longimicrobium sp.]